MERYPKKRNPAETLAELKRVAARITSPIYTRDEIEAARATGHRVEEIFPRKPFNPGEIVEREREMRGRIDCISGLWLADD